MDDSFVTVKKAVLVTGILIFSVECFAQDRDSIPKGMQDHVNIPRRRTVAYVTDKFAIARPLNIEFTHSAPYNFTSKMEGNSLPESKVTGFAQAKVNANFNFIKRNTWLLGATLGYRYTHAEADLVVPETFDITTVDDDFHYHFTSLNFSFFSTLFKKRTIYTSSLLVDGSDKHFERIKGMLTGTMVLKANERTKMTVGILISIDPSSQTLLFRLFPMSINSIVA